MSVIRGHEDLRPKAIVGFEMGYALVQVGEGVKRYRMTVTAGGGLAAYPLEGEPVQAVDQIDTLMEPAPDLRARRFHDIDQPIE